MNVKIRKPFDGEYKVTFKFGAAPHWYVNRIGFPHSGIDYDLPVGTPVFACDDGVVVEIDYHPTGWGHFVRISHKWGISHYAHLKNAPVTIGELVDSDSLIGLSGRSGWVTGPHLHFGIKVAGVPALEMKGWVDPTPYFVGHEAVDLITCPQCGFVFPIVGK